MPQLSNIQLDKLQDYKYIVYAMQASLTGKVRTFLPLEIGRELSLATARAVAREHTQHKGEFTILVDREKHWVMEGYSKEVTVNAAPWWRNK